LFWKIKLFLLFFFHRFIAEEDASATGEKGLTESPTWIIDPIDGTINFVKKLHFVCISVALAVEGDLKIAFLYNPTLDELYTARKGQGAFLNGVKIESSKTEDLSRCLLAHEISLGTVPIFAPKYIERARALLGKCLGLRALGSAALTLGYVAKGAIDAYNIEDLKPWDIAAGALIVKESGGVVIDVSGGEYNIMKPNIIAAGNQTLAEKIRTIVKEIDDALELEGKSPNQLKLIN
jgi:myo-inositol-1(or 4)-monophosphatase